jgi:hypothetical protein
VINVPGVVGDQRGVVDPGPGRELVGNMMIIRNEFFTFLILFIRGTCG